MDEKYCSECSGTVNPGSACPRKTKPGACPLSLTEAEHYDNLAKEEEKKAKAKKKADAAAASGNE